MDSDSTSDKISCDNNLQASQRLRKAIMEMWDDGYTLHEISESMPGIHCIQVAEIISRAIREDAGRCA